MKHQQTQPTKQWHWKWTHTSKKKRQIDPQCSARFACHTNAINQNKNQLNLLYEKKRAKVNEYSKVSWFIKSLWTPCRFNRSSAKDINWTVLIALITRRNIFTGVKLKKNYSTSQKNTVKPVVKQEILMTGKFHDFRPQAILQQENFAIFYQWQKGIVKPDIIATGNFAIFPKIAQFSCT